MSIDYGFAPYGIDPHYENARTLLRERDPQTKVIDDINIKDVETFIKHLRIESSIKKPIGDLVIVSHSLDSGWMDVDLDTTSTVEDKVGSDPAEHTTYEVLVQAARDKSVRIPDSLHQKPPPDPPGPPIPFDVHIRGCRIGKSPPFVKKLKEAFHSPNIVTAPIHFHFVAPYLSKRRPIKLWASFECLLYAFQILRPHVPIKKAKKMPRSETGKRQFLNKQEAVEAFDKKGFEYIPKKPPPTVAGTKVPIQVWKKWIPDNVIDMGKPLYQKYENIKLGVDIADGSNRDLPHLTQLGVQHQFRHELDKHEQSSIKTAAKPANKAEEKEILTKAIKEDPLFQDDYGLPMYVRHGYTKVEDFLNGLNWFCNPSKDGKLLTCTGYQDVYTVLVPVLDPDNNNNLFCNVFPFPGSGIKLYKNLSVIDGRLFHRA